MAPSNRPSDSISDCLANVFELSNGKLTVNGVSLLTQVPINVSFKPFSLSSSDAPPPLLRRVSAHSHKGCFLGFKQDQPSDRLVNSLGTFEQREFVSIFRFKTWWSTMWVGKSGSDLQMETQWVLLNVPENESYVLILPLIEGSFRSALHPGTEGSVLICAESGSTQVKDSSFDSLAYLHVSDNPYNLMKEALSAVRVHLNTFKLLEEKQVPNLADKFGWCTWDAFYLTVDPAGVFHGLNDFVAGGLSPRFVIIDDGWQSISFDGEYSGEDAKNLVLGGTQMTGRLHRFDENEKFRNYKAGSFLGHKPPSFNPKRPKMLISKAIEIEQAEKDRDKAIRSGISDLSEFESRIRKLKQELNEMFGEDDKEQSFRPSHGNSSCGDDQSFGMKAFARDLRTKFKGLDDIYVWHALCGAWGGVRPNSTHLSSTVTPCKLSPGLDRTMTDLAVVKIVEGGIGLVHPDQADDFFNSMHSYLSRVGITGVKVDVIHCLEYICEEYRGRVELAKAYYAGLSRSMAKNFNGTGLIASMQQCNDFFFLGTNQISMGRVGDDFWFQDPNGDPMGVYWLQGVHMIHCAYNSMWMGQIIRPDWDMFQSDHVCAEFHAGSRAICGGPVYVSDSVDGHDFDLLKKLVFPDGTVPVCRHYALPTRDCLFRNPLFDNTSLLKIWNLNKYGGVIGAFNCQGAGWDPKEQRIKGYPHCYNPITGSLDVNDIEWDQNSMEATTLDKSEEFIIYLNWAKHLTLATPKSEPIRVTVEPSSFELFTVVPVKRLGPSIKFAPIGLTNMFNSGGTVQELEYLEEGGGAAKVKVKGGGSFSAYSSGRPKKCWLNGGEVADYEWLDDGRIVLDLPWVEENGGVSCVDFYF